MNGLRKRKMWAKERVRVYETECVVYIAKNGILFGWDHLVVWILYLSLSPSAYFCRILILRKSVLLFHSFVFTYWPCILIISNKFTRNHLLWSFLTRSRVRAKKLISLITEKVNVYHIHVNRIDVNTSKKRREKYWRERVRAIVEKAIHTNTEFIPIRYII